MQQHFCNTNFFYHDNISIPMTLWKNNNHVQDNNRATQSRASTQFGYNNNTFIMTPDNDDNTFSMTVGYHDNIFIVQCMGIELSRSIICNYGCMVKHCQWSIWASVERTWAPRAQETLDVEWQLDLKILHLSKSQPAFSCLAIVAKFLPKKKNSQQPIPRNKRQIFFLHWPNTHLVNIANYQI